MGSRPGSSPVGHYRLPKRWISRSRRTASRGVAGLALACAVLLLCSYGCASRSYRLIGERGDAVLVPPGVRTPDVGARTFKIPIHDKQADCGLEQTGISIRRLGNTLWIAVDRETLAARPPGWLVLWSDWLRERGCVAQDQARSFVVHVAQSFPLALPQSYAVHFGNEVRAEFMDFLPGQQLRIVGPVFRDGPNSKASAVGPVVSTQGGPEGGLNSAVRASPDLIGYEESWFAVRPGADGALRLEHQRTKSFQQGEVVTLVGPQATSFAFLSGARFMRMIYLVRVAEGHDHDLPFVKAPTRRELDARSAAWSPNRVAVLRATRRTGALWAPASCRSISS